MKFVKINLHSNEDKMNVAEEDLFFTKHLKEYEKSFIITKIVTGFTSFTDLLS